MANEAARSGKGASRVVRSIADLISPAGNRGRLCILIYHRVLSVTDPILRLEPDAETFSWQMQAVAEHFNVLPLFEAIERLQKGALPARAASITFDDGYADNAIVALPVLQKCHLPATFFVASGYLDGGRMWNDTVIEAVKRTQAKTLDFSDIGLGKVKTADIGERRDTVSTLLSKLKYLSAQERDRCVKIIAERAAVALPNNLMMQSQQVKTLSEAGMDIGAHTVTHPILTRLAERDALHEIVESRQQLFEITRVPVRLFAYPNGKPGEDYDFRHVSMVKQLGFAGAVSTAWGAAKRSADTFQLPRFTPWDKTPKRFLLRMLRNYAYH
jgi:peptidoglycan/xylan/chitin deacetylase (PgdA/CDA1 family)